ncbi:MAG: class IV adenylate cyclase [Anaerolineaceae bacterium]
MNHNNLEMEVKFYLMDPLSFEQRLRSIGASMTQPRTFETNLRFDTPDLALTKAHRVLRLRKDQANFLTYKGPSEWGKAVAVRQEIEIEVSDFESTQLLLEALGYKISVRYEKWRAKYFLEKVEIDLDEMPFGHFVEIEGDDAKKIERVAAMLSLNWSTRVNDSYIRLFERMKSSKHLDVHDLTFGDFKKYKISPEDLGVKPGDTVAYL